MRTKKMELKRKFDEYLRNWKEQRKTALLVLGARQTGKTFAIQRFIDKEFSSVVHFDFSSGDSYVDTFSLAKGPDDFLMRLSALAGERLIPGQTVIFLDEIQILYKKREFLIERGEIDPTFPDILSLMKPLSMRGDFRYILTGSLLGVTLRGLPFNPAGYLDTYKMYPLDFEEFAMNKGAGANAFSYLRDCFLQKKEVDPAINRLFLDYFKEYVIVGGMPQSVSYFLEDFNLYGVQQSQETIMEAYMTDIMEYVRDADEKLRIREIYAAIPTELDSKNKRFISSHVIDSNYLKRNDLVDEYLWLKGAGIALPVYNVDQPTISLHASSDRKTLKLFMSDVGLLGAALLQTGTRKKILNGETNINYGAPYENAIAQELWAHGFSERLYYYNSKKNGEVDFLIERGGSVLPIEIKSGKPEQMNVYNHCALNNLLKVYPIEEAYVFGTTNVLKESDKIFQFPLYMVSFLDPRD